MIYNLTCYILINLQKNQPISDLGHNKSNQFNKPIIYQKKVSINQLHTLKINLKIQAHQPYTITKATNGNRDNIYTYIDMMMICIQACYVLTLCPLSMYFIATSSLVSLFLISLATPKFPEPISFTSSYLSIFLFYIRPTICCTNLQEK